MVRLASIFFHPLALALAVLVSCSAPEDGGSAKTVKSLEDIKQSGVLRVGVNPNFPPMSAYGQTNKLEGFDVDIANRIGQELGVAVETGAYGSCTARSGF